MAVACAVVLCGCSYKLASLVSADESDPQTTGAITPSAAAPAGDIPKPSPRAELDLAYARAAVSNVLSRGGKDTSVPWQNPQTGAGGNIMPLANSFT
jgi:17 kDa outer membrane surface antigen